MKRPGSNQAASFSNGRIHIPAILLEGDDSRSFRSARGGSRFQGTASQKPATTLPRAYGTGKLMVAVRDPHCLYATWDFTDEQQEHHNALSRSRRLSLRAVEIGSNEIASEVETHPESRHWFLNVSRGAANYVVQLGYYEAGGEWKIIRESGAVATPPDRVAERRDVRSSRHQKSTESVPATAGLFPNISIEEILARIGKVVPERDGTAAGHQETIKTPVLPGDRDAAASASLQRIYAELYGLQDLPDWTALSSLELVRDYEAVSSPIGGVQPKRGFWFSVDAELIVYGATSPDAQVTMGGRPIQLRPDGTFSLRFALPDGDHTLPLTATSADRQEVRYAELRFRRESDYGTQSG